MNNFNNKLNQEGNILSFDFGEKRVGVAVGNNITNNVHPLETIETEKKMKDTKKLSRFLKYGNQSIL